MQQRAQQSLDYVISGALLWLPLHLHEHACAVLRVQGRTTGDAIKLALGDLATHARSADCRQGAVSVAIHACIPPEGATSKRCQYTCVEVPCTASDCFAHGRSGRYSTHTMIFTTSVMRCVCMPPSTKFKRTVVPL